MLFDSVLTPSRRIDMDGIQDSKQPMVGDVSLTRFLPSPFFTFFPLSFASLFRIQGEKRKRKNRKKEKKQR